MSAMGEALRRLEDAVGADHLITATEAVSAYALEGQQPLAAAQPGTGEEVAGVLRAAAESSLTVLLRGAGRHLYYGGPCGPIGVLVSLARLNEVVHYDADDLTITAQAGLTLSALRKTVAAYGQMLPLDPPGPEEATIGGIAAAGLAGPLRMTYGSPRDLVLGLRVALTSGEVIKTGGRTVKNVAGYDLTKLFLGSFGTVGAVVEVTLRLVPAPEERALFAAAVSPARAGETTAALLAAQLEIATCDVLSHRFARGIGLPIMPQPDQLLVLLGVMGAREAVARQDRQLRATFPEGVTHLEGEEVWAQVRDATYPAGEGCLLRLNVPMAKVMDMVEMVASRPDWAAAVRAGDGIIYALGPAERETLLTFRAAAERAGGHAVLESGPVELKRAFPVWGQTVPNADLMRALKQRFDPAGVLGCGRFVPET